MRKVFAIALMFLAVAAIADELAIGAKAPAFTLANAVDGKTYAFKPGDGKISVVFFTCNQCPYAKAFEPRLIDLYGLPAALSSPEGIPHVSQPPPPAGARQTRLLCPLYRFGTRNLLGRPAAPQPGRPLLVRLHLHDRARSRRRK